MAILRTILQAGCLISALILLIGLYKPYIALWWKPMSNRLMVIKIYGISLLIFCSLALLIDLAL